MIYVAFFLPFIPFMIRDFFLIPSNNGKLLLERSPADNWMDSTCRILMIFYLTISALAILFMMSYRAWHRTLQADELPGMLFVWYAAYFYVGFILGWLKAIGGHHESPSGYPVGQFSPFDTMPPPIMDPGVVIPPPFVPY